MSRLYAFKLTEPYVGISKQQAKITPGIEKGRKWLSPEEFQHLLEEP